MKIGDFGLLAMLVLATQSFSQERQAPIVLARSGGFVIGGRVVANPGNSAEHLSCDHGYVEYFLPANPRSTSLVMWHSSSAQVWQNRWDGGEGYKDMFLRRDYPVYLWDGPRVGRANWACEQITYSPSYRDEANFTAWNFGPSYGSWWPGVQFPVNDAKSWQAATASRYVEYDALRNIQLETDAAAVAADSGRLGNSIVYLTNSAGGLRAMVTATKAAQGNIVGIVAYESIGYVFPIGDPESPAACTDPGSCGFGPVGIPLEDFRKLAQLKSIQFVWGDHRSGPDAANATYVEQSRLCAKLINKYGGHAQVLMLGEDAGLKGSTHIPFADMDNARVAALLDAFLKKAGLDGYPSAKRRGHWVWDN
ncbi:MAG: alpha/beta fold hydrolase [Pseudomonadota bacterium]